MKIYILIIITGRKHFCDSWVISLFVWVKLSFVQIPNVLGWLIKNNILGYVLSLGQNFGHFE